MVIRTMVDQADLSLARLACERPRIVLVRYLSKEALSVRPRNRETGDLWDVLAFHTRSVLVCGIAWSGRVTRVKRQEFDTELAEQTRITLEVRTDDQTIQ